MIAACKAKDSRKPIAVLSRRIGVMPSSFWASLALTLPIVLCVAAASWYLVERPLIELAGRRAGVARRLGGPLYRRGARRRREPQLEAHAAP